MSSLTLIRHGQAAAFTEDSDRLTELGEAQGRALGAYWVAAGARFDEVWTGNLRRQTQTEALVAEVFDQAGAPWPEARVDPGWNEYDSGGVTGILVPRLAERDPAFKAQVEAFAAAAGKPDQNRYFQRMFETVMTRWIAGDLDDDQVEPFELFHGRVMAARQRILDAAGSRRVAVFTSGGPIGACVQATLQAPLAQAMAVNWRVKNASLTEFLFSRDRISLDAFNGQAHLPDPALQSFR